MEIEKRKGRSTLLTINGITKPTTEWAKETGVDTVLHYIYDDATVYLDRKYDKFLDIVDKLEGYNEVQIV